MVFFPNAKINLGLHVTSKREDGYHTIESIFCPIKMHDSIEIHTSDLFTLHEHQKSLSATSLEENTIFKAWKHLADDFKISPLSVDLIKHIPSGAGLGGGSSDASHMLLACNSLFKLNLSNEQLSSYAKKIGSDCSFFIHNRPCYVTGIGHDLQPINLNMPSVYIAVIHPFIHISTKEAYSNIRPKEAKNSLLDIVQHTPIEEWKNYIVNDFEESVFSIHPILSAIKQTLYDQGAIYASMSGSGSCIYGLFKDDPIKELKYKWPHYFTWTGTFL